MDYSAKHVLITGGTGALGTAVASALFAAGATCTVPYVPDGETHRFPVRAEPNGTLIAVDDLAEEAEVAKHSSGIKRWASIHIAGGFSAGKVAETDKKALMAQIDSNLTSCFI